LWDQLASEFSGAEHKTVIADVDCTLSENEKWCHDDHGVEGYPTLKYGKSIDKLEVYKGKRDPEELRKFVKSQLGPECNPAHLAQCSAADRKMVEEYLSLPLADLETEIEYALREMEIVESDFKAKVDEMQKEYTELESKKRTDLAEIADTGVGMMKTVSAYRNLVKVQEAAQKKASEEL